MPRSTSAKRTTRRARTLTGCSTCRRRHVKCDQNHPRCLTCQNMGIECGGFVPGLRWVSSEQSCVEDDGIATRRHLYSEQARERMALSLSERLTHGSVDASLQEVDDRASISARSAGQAESFSNGPFGVFDPKLATKFAQQHEHPLPMSHVTQAQHDPTLDTIPTGISPVATWDSVNSVVSANDVLHWDDIFEFDWESPSNPPINTLDPLLAFSDIKNDQYDLGIYASNHQTFDLTLDKWGMPLGTYEGAGVTSPQRVPLSLETLELAPKLLKHFKKHVIQHISALPITSKSPWEIVNLVSAVDTYAQLTFLETESVTNAKRAGLYGLLCLSANHLARNPTFDEDLDRQDGYWDNVARLCRVEAVRNLQTSLAVETQVPNKAKYKDQLVAILNLLGVSVNTGAQRDARVLMNGAERLMRHRGLAKKEVSRKSRLLHHMYTWVRIVCESTYVLHDYVALVERLELRRTSYGHFGHHKNASTAENNLDDFLRLKPQYDEIEQQSAEQAVDEAQETALRDIHLEDLRENPNTMYGLIYGISETWLRLLSQTTRLANQMDAIRATENMMEYDSLLMKAAQIEDAVCSLASASSLSTANALPNMHLHKALNSALVIFFYRRIRHVNPWILQCHVDDVIRALACFDEASTRQTVDGPGLVWPAFMAACEAISARRRDHLMRWIERASAKTGIHYYGQAKEIILEVWRCRDSFSVPVSEANGIRGARASPQYSRSTWMDILREKKIWLMAC